MLKKYKSLSETRYHELREQKGKQGSRFRPMEASDTRISREMYKINVY